MTPGEGAPGGDPLSKLYARKIYDNFNNGPQCRYRGSSSEGTLSELKTILNKYLRTAHHADNIFRNWCNVGLTPESGDRGRFFCPFLYYWLGDIVYEEVKITNTFKGVISAIYGTLGKYIAACKYEDVYKSTSKHQFDQMKKVFDYSYNYITIKKDLNDFRFDCAEKYSKYLEEVHKDYESIKASCLRGSSDSNAYCTHINTIFTEGSGPKELNSECESLNNTNPDLVVSKHKEERANRANFFFYRQFNQGSCLLDQSSKTNIDDILKTYSEISDVITDIENAWCEMTKHKDDVGDNAAENFCKYCNFLYFWIGDKIWNQLTDSGTDAVGTKFTQIMSFICAKLVELCSSGGCSPDCGSIDRSTFYQEKEKYTASQDQMNEESSRRRQSQRLLPNAESLGTESEDGQLDLPGAPYAWCLPGKDNLASTSCAMLPNLPDSSSPTTTSGTNTIPALVSSTAVLMGLPFLAFLLYKYNILSSWISNYFGKGKNRRKRRSTARQQQFDTFTENSSTYDSATEGSTIGYIENSEASSTIGSTTIEEESNTLYSVQYTTATSNSRKGRGGNNTTGRRKNIHYQAV